jgi:hypothetical protein
MESTNVAKTGIKNPETAEHRKNEEIDMEEEDSKLNVKEAYTVFKEWFYQDEVEQC